MARTACLACWLAVVVVLWTGCGSVSAAGGTGSKKDARASTRAPSNAKKPTRTRRRRRSHGLFAPSSVWNTKLAADAPVDPQSAAMTQWLDAAVNHEFAKGPTPNIQTGTGSTTIYRVPADQPAVPVHLDVPVKYKWGRSLARVLRAGVPIPAGARPSGGPDAEMTVYQPSTDRLWELWKARRTKVGWEASWGGAMENVSRSPGYFSAHSWPGAASYWGASATSLPLIAGTMLIGELEGHRIDHALAIALPETRAGEYAWPAQRTDGYDHDPDVIPEGAHLRIDPHLDIAVMHLPPVIRTMALAAQRYGMIVRDQTGGEAFAFYAETPTGSADPYPKIFGGMQPYDLLKSFPWSHLQVLKMKLHSGSGTPG